MGSSRLPGKVLLELTPNLTVLDWVVKRVEVANCVEQVIVATTTDTMDDVLVNHCKKMNYNVFRGAQENVLERYFHCAKSLGEPIIIRITADCPLICPELIDAVFDKKLKDGAQYGSNVSPPTFPDGLDVEIFDFEILKDCFENAKTKLEQEHVTTWIINNKEISHSNLSCTKDYSDFRLTLDKPIDLDVISRLIVKEHLSISSTLHDVLMSIKNNPLILKLNSSILRNEGFRMSNYTKLWARARDVIPGGNGLFSKRPTLFSPSVWPTYFSSTSGIKIKDLDGNEFKDFIMAVGTNTLGYNHPEVDAAVVQGIKRGNMSTLNPFEEVT